MTVLANAGRFEALLRWQHPAKGLLSPGDFIAHSEKTGIIIELGRFALERAATDLAHWQRYFPLKPPLFVNVNFSRRQLKDAGFEALLKTVLSGSGIAAGTLNLEITETAIAADTRMPQIMARIRAAGAGLSIDDFGTGASTLSELRTLPADTVKIDKSFLARHGGTDIDSDGEVVLSGIVSMAHELKRAVVAEGVESEADAQYAGQNGLRIRPRLLFFARRSMPPAALDYIARHYNICGRSRKSADPFVSQPMAHQRRPKMAIKVGDKSPLGNPDGNAGRQAHPGQARTDFFAGKKVAAVRPAGRLHPHLLGQACARLSSPITAR